MAKLSLEGMEFYAQHGVYEEETILGGKYTVDVTVEVDIVKAAVTDDIQSAVNYEVIHAIVKSAMQKPTKLIETIVERIGLGLKNHYPHLKEMYIRVVKHHPPLGGIVKQAVIETKADYRKKCGRCSKPMLCYQDKTCWCMDAGVMDQGRLEHLKLNFDNSCLCSDCVQYYAG